MDIFTHALMGALIGQAASPRNAPASLPLWCALAALIPDLDVLFMLASDPLLGLELHRHFSHSLLLAPLIGLAASQLFMKVTGAEQGYRGTFILAVLSAVLLDACTSYGVHLFWPLLDERIALNLIPVVDPIITASLLAALLAAHWWHCGAALAGLALLLAYPAVGAIQQSRAADIAEHWAAQNDIEVQRLLVKPTLGNLLLWRVLIDDGKHVQPLAVRAAWDSNLRAGEKVSVHRADWWGYPADSVVGDALIRFDRESGHWLVPHEDEDLVVGDLRYAMLPHGHSPLWGLRLPPEPDGELERVTFRETHALVRKAFFDMLLGRDPEFMAASH